MTNRTNTTTRWLGLVLGVQGLILLSIWTGLPVARADGIPDAGAQREAIIDQLKSANAKLDTLNALLSGGKLQVTVRKSADQ